MPLVRRTDPGHDHYIRFDDDDNTTLPMTAGTGADADQYTLADATIAAAELPAGTYSGVMRRGDSEAPLSTDLRIAEFTSFAWGGEEEVPPTGESISFTITNQRT